MPRKGRDRREIVSALKQVEIGVDAREICREYKISLQTLCQWKRKYGGMGEDELLRLHALEAENRTLRQSVENLTLEKEVLQDIIKKTLTIAVKRELVTQAHEHFRIGYQRACGLFLLRRSVFYYRSQARDRSELKNRVLDLAKLNVGFGYLRITVLLREEGWLVGKKLVYRLYRELGLGRGHRGFGRSARSRPWTVPDARSLPSETADG